MEPSQDGAAEASAVTGLAQRPAELPVAGVDPCKLYSRAALRELRISQRPRAGSAAGAKTCTLSQQRAKPMYDLLVTAYPDTGVETWISGRMARPDAMTAEPFTVDGFPAVRIAPSKKPPGECEVAVGVAQGQAVHVRFGTPFRDEFDNAKACELAARAAAAAVSALREKE